MHKLLQITEQTLWQIIGRVVLTAGAFVSLGLVTRNYDKLEVGAYTLAQTYLAMFFIIADLGFNAYVLKKLKRNSDEANRLLNVRLYWSIFLALFASILILILPLGDGLVKMAVILGAVTIIGSGVFTSVSLIFQKELKYQLSIIAQTSGSLVMVLSLIVLVYLKVQVPFLLICYSLGWIFNNWVSLKLVNKYYHFRLTSPDYKYFISLFKKVWPISVTLILNVVYFRFDAFILAAVRGLSDTAIYNLSYALFQTALFIPTFIMNSYYPIILKELNNKVLLFRQLRIAFFIMINLSLIGTLLTFVLSEQIVNLITGGGFDGSIISINILSLSFPAFFGTALLMWVYVSLEKYKSLLWIYSIGLSANVLLNFIFTPVYSYIATSWITVFSEYLILVMQIVVLLFEPKARTKQ